VRIGLIPRVVLWILQPMQSLSDHVVSELEAALPELEVLWDGWDAQA
jgi:hypothetical protein